MELRKGDLIEVQWLDIYEDLIGDPDKADVYPRVSIGYFWCLREGKHGVTVFVTTTTMESEEMGQNGYCAYPEACVAKVKMIRRGKGKVYREQPSFEWPKPQRSSLPSERFTDPGDLAQQRGEGKVRGPGNVERYLQQVGQGDKPEA